MFFYVKVQIATGKTSFESKLTLVLDRLLMRKHIFAALAFHGLDRPLLAFADLYLPYLALIEFFGQLEVFLVKKYIEMNHFHYSNIKNNFQTKF